MRLTGVTGLDPLPKQWHSEAAKLQNWEYLTTAKILRKCKKMAQKSPVLLFRRSFRAVGESCVTNLIPDPRPDRTHPRPLSWSHYWHLAVTLFRVKAPTTSGLSCSYQAVGRGVAVLKISEKGK